MSQPSASVTQLRHSDTRDRVGVRRKLNEAFRTGIAGILLVAAIVGVLVVATLVGHRSVGRLAVLDLALILILSFIPGWLYVRFIGQRAGALWDEFVLNLYRLQFDDPRHLPAPPKNSVYARLWGAGDDSTSDIGPSIYRKKFDAYYGRKAAESGSSSRVNPETFFPVVLATVLIAVAWTVILWGDTFPATVPAAANGALAYGFIGAYVFSLQMLGRRFFQRDLKPSAYASVVMRFIAVGAIVLVVHQLPGIGESPRTQAIVAFTVGMFPLVGIQAISRFTSNVLKGTVQSLETTYPLSQLDGLNIWYEARLLEEGIEDMENLVSANLVDVMLHSRVPVGRLVDWIDQAHLFLHLAPVQTKPKTEEPAPADDPTHVRSALRVYGVSNATTFLKAFDVDAEGKLLCPAARPALEQIAANAKIEVEALLTVGRLLHDDPALRPLHAWRDGEGVTNPTWFPRAA